MNDQEGCQEGSEGKKRLTHVDTREPFMAVARVCER